MNEQEVDIRDYIGLILNRKWLIIIMTLLGVVVAGCLNFYYISNQSVVYEGSVWLEIGETKSRVLIESSEQIIKKVGIGVYGSGGAIAKNIKGTNLIEIIAKSVDLETPKVVLEEVSSAIIGSHLEKITVRKKGLESRLKNNKDKIDLLEQNKDELKKNLKSSFGTNALIVSNLLFSANQEINDLQFIVSTLEEKLNGMYATKIVKETEVFDNSGTQKLSLNLIMGGLIGLFLGFLMSFVIEWWRKPRYKSAF